MDRCRDSKIVLKFWKVSFSLSQAETCEWPCLAINFRKGQPGLGLDFPTRVTARKNECLCASRRWLQLLDGQGCPARLCV